MCTFPLIGTLDALDVRMRSMQRMSWWMVVGLVAVACESSGGSSDSGLFGDSEIPGEGGDDGGGGGSGGLTGAGDEGGDGAAGDSAGDGGGEPSGGGAIEPGTLTAGVWDDNLNFELFSQYRAAFAASGAAGTPPFDESEHASAHAAAEDHAKQRLDISLVIDTTGSMGDEIAYLQTEFDALSSTISERYPDAQQRWSLVVYRDQTDEYVVRWFDFRDDPQEFRTRLGEQMANGGGDFPEAPDQALEIANQLTWRAGDDVARLIFWVADAPHHDDHAQALADAVRDAAAEGIHIYPVASSGIDELTEFSMRATAQLTGGRYIFLTDDSGVGAPHVEPTIPCYFVTKLDDAILRMVDIEITGEYREPSESEILRVGGDPQDGACTLPDGQSVFAF
jgi:hypothetical protein